MDIRHRGAWSVAVALMVCAQACGGGSLKETFAPEGDAAYAKRCGELETEHEKQRADLGYNPPTLLVHKWPSTLPGGSDATLFESAFIEALAEGEADFLLVVARGGVGKSTLARATEAQLCRRVPTLRVDLASAVAPKLSGLGEGKNAIVEAIAADLGPEDAASFRGGLAKERAVLLLDSLDEVSLDQRPAVIEQVEQLRKLARQATVAVFARPSVYVEDYGFERVQARVELPPLTCGRSKATMAWTGGSDADFAVFEKFLHAYYLDAQSTSGGQCYYPFLATYRDIQVAQRLAKKFVPGGKLEGLPSNLVTVHETIVGERLKKELDFLEWQPSEILDAVDEVVHVRGLEGGEWNLEFTVERCIEANKGRAPEEAARRQLCAKILQSALFEPIGGDAPIWRFGHQQVGALFLARWVERKLAETPGDCKLIAGHPELFERDVAGYLVGKKHGGACLATVAEAMCKDHGYKLRDVELLFKGLPLGPARATLADGARAATAGLPKGSCVAKLLAGL